MGAIPVILDKNEKSLKILVCGANSFFYKIVGNCRRGCWQTKNVLSFSEDPKNDITKFHNDFKSDILVHEIYSFFAPFLAFRGIFQVYVRAARANCAHAPKYWKIRKLTSI